MAEETSVQISFSAEGGWEGSRPSVTVDKCASEGRPFCTITPRIADSQSSLPVPPAPARPQLRMGTQYQIRTGFFKEIR